jgi:hypothetical protein
MLDFETTDAERDKVREMQMLLSELVTERNNLNQICEDIAWLIDPPSVNTFIYGSEPIPYDPSRTDKQIDATGTTALARFKAICDSLLTPRNQMWHTLASTDPTINRNRAAREWFQTATRTLFHQRYSPVTNFTAQNQMVYHGLGGYGNGIMYVDGFYDITRRKKQLRYKSIPLGEIYFTENHQGLYDGFIRPMRLNARQIVQMFKAEVPWIAQHPMLAAALENKSLRRFTIAHWVAPREDYDSGRIDVKGKPWSSCYIFVEGQKILREGGYNSFPVAASRYQQGPGEKYGTGIAQQVLPALKTLNAEKKIFLKAGHRAADPVLLLADDGLVGMNMIPGAQNKGGISADGKRLVDTIPIGNVQITEEMMSVEGGIINDMFLVSLFQIMTESSGMTATEVIERINEKGILIAPTMGRQEGEYLSPLIDREIDILMQMELLPPMPPILREAGGEYQVIYQSPLAKAARAQEAAGFFRTLEGVKEIVNITGDRRPLYRFNFDRAIPDIMDIQGVPIEWISTDEEVASMEQEAQQNAQDEKNIQAAPAAASIIKAQADAAKAGVGPGAPPA